MGLKHTTTVGRVGRRAFSLVELLVLVAIVVILITILMPYVRKVQEADRRARCTDNLRAIGLALQNYAKQSTPARNEYPRVRQSPVQPGSYVAYTGADSPDPFAHDTGVKANDVTASLWLMVRAGLIEPQRFVCPSGGQAPDPASAGDAGRRRSNFASGKHLSYSYRSPFSGHPKFELNPDLLPADFALVADKNPGTSGKGDAVNTPRHDAPPLDLAPANSNNHGGAGQNVLFAFGHVVWQQTPYCGVGREWYRDNIYTAYAAQPVTEGDPSTAPQAPGVCTRDAGPAWAYDSFLVPTDDE